MTDLILKKGKERSLLRRHPWVYDTAVQKLSNKAKSGDTVRVVSHDGRFLAWAAYSKDSTLRARCWSFNEDEEINDVWIEAKIQKALKAREHLFTRTTAVRVIFGEADQLPGLVVDRYGEWFVTQFQAAGVEAFRDVIADILMKVPGIKGIFDRSNYPSNYRDILVIKESGIFYRLYTRERARGVRPSVFELAYDNAPSSVVEEFMTDERSGGPIKRRAEERERKYNYWKEA